MLEEYNCGFGLNPAYRDTLEKSDLHITGVDADNEVRVIELEGHPFFLATLYQPERAARDGRAHPLVDAFVQAIVDEGRRPTSEDRRPTGHRSTDN